MAAIFLSALAISGVAIVLIVNNRAPGLPLILVALFLLLLTLKLSPLLANKYRNRQRSTLRSAESLMKDDPRPPVLYLRSFKDDEKIARAIAFYSIEQEMKVALFDIGPLIAMAEPDKEDPQDPGAARLRLQRDSWRAKVGEEMSRAALVIMRIADTDGFWWEMREAPKRVKPQRLVLLIPAEDEKLYDEFCRKAVKCLPRPLPKYKRSKGPFRVQGGIVYFEPDWTAQLQKFKVEWFRQTVWSPFTVVLKFALRPVYKQLGIEWTTPGLQPTQFLYILVLCLLMLFAVYLIYVMFTDFLKLL